MTQKQYQTYSDATQEQSPHPLHLYYDDGSLYLEQKQLDHSPTQALMAKQKKAWHLGWPVEWHKTLENRFKSHQSYQDHGHLLQLSGHLYFFLILLMKELGFVEADEQSRGDKRPCLYYDHARTYLRQKFIWQKSLTPRVHQQHAFDAWLKAKGRGCVVLPTGSGKTVLACMIMSYTARSVMIVVPTIDLVEQWRGVITEHFGLQVAVWGGGEKQIAEITVITYDSAIY
ncbi:MAG: DEAD/DEAH box helicase family protein, partial [Proteobacteria bacterium]|nr:DEAD/DEAH box helicase family protein [Pseudomonadota bacterium]